MVTAPRTLPRRPVPSCARTGSPTSACMAAPDGGCGYCGVPAAEAWARAEALDDERARLIVEGLT